MSKPRLALSTTRPILFNGAMVRAILDGSKTQTRRLLKMVQLRHGHVGVRVCGAYPSVVYLADEGLVWCPAGGMAPVPYPNPERCCPLGVPGDRLWVRETHAIVPASAYRCSREPNGEPVAHRASLDGLDWAIYRSTWTRCAPARWRPSIHMPRWASRITLEVTDVRVERVQDISEGDIRSEGVTRIAGPTYADPGASGPDPWEAFSELWNSVYAKRELGWTANPWVWAVTFRRVEG